MNKGNLLPKIINTIVYFVISTLHSKKYSSAKSVCSTAVSFEILETLKTVRFRGKILKDSLISYHALTLLGNR